MRTSHFKWFTIFALALTTAACSPAEKASFGGGSSEENSTAPSTDGSPLYIYLQGKYEGTTVYENIGQCIVPSGTAETTDTPCTITVPELKLYYSDLKFVVGTTSSAYCRQVSFQPFYYVRETSNATYSEYGATAPTDCSGTSPEAAACYGGMAPALLGSSFPSSKGLYFLPDYELEHSYTVDSLNKRRIANPDDPTYTAFGLQGSVTNATNTLVDRVSAKVASAASPVNYDGGNQYYDYTVSCNDQYGYTSYSITLTIADGDGTDTSDGRADDYLDWD